MKAARAAAALTTIATVWPGVALQTGARLFPRRSGMQDRSIQPCANIGAWRPSTQVVTDIDDTVKSSGGVTLAGIPLGGVDVSYARGVFYPGVFQFGLELARSQRFLGQQPPKVAVLTARAKELKWALEITPSSPICVRYAEAGAANQLSAWGVGPVLYGSVKEWVCQDRKGWRKYDNFRLLRAGAPLQRRYVFIGDNGASERDLEAAEQIIQTMPGALRAVFLHAVSPNEQPAPLPEDTQLAGVPILYFRTYAAAAAKAVQHSLFKRRAMHRVLDAIEADMKEALLGSAPGSDNEQLLLKELADARALARPVWARPATAFSRLLKRPALRSSGAASIDRVGARPGLASNVLGTDRD